MSVLSIVRPYPISAIAGTADGAARLMTPDPKEAAIIVAAGSKTIDIDLGVARSIDTIFLGYTSAAAADVLTATYGTAGYTTTAWGSNIAAADSQLLTPIRHFYSKRASPVTARYIRLTGTFTAGYAIGMACVGLSFNPQYGHEYGGGRGVISTGTAERLFSGGFGIDEGTTAGMWQFTLGDLQPAEVRQLYAIARDRGETKSLLVVEDPDAGADLAERCHWGIFRKIEAYERLDPANTRWSFTVEDWA